MNPEHVRKYVETVWEDSILPTLAEYIRIPNKSPAFDADWQAHGYMSQAIALLDGWCDTLGIQGLQRQVVTLKGRTPLLFCEVAASPGVGGGVGGDGGDRTALLYGHYDKQPEFDGWHEGLSPWEPVTRDGKLYGRGGADDGYALFGSLAAIGALQEQGVPHCRCVLIIEGCEESGSFDLPFYIDHLSERIGTPELVVCLDAECGNYDQLWLTDSLRGMLPGTLSVNILTQGQHSGAAGGIVPSSFRILREVMDRVENASTGELHKALHVDIPAHAVKQLQAVAQTLGTSVVDKFPWVPGAKPTETDPADLLIANSWEPSLATVGLGGAPAIADAGNTLRPGTQAKLVFRLPPTLDAETAANAIKEVLEANPPHGAEVTFALDTPQTGWSAPETATWLESSLQAASARYFGKPAMHMGMGGTIPFMKMLGDRYPSVQFMVTGVLGPMSNAHGPNEFLHIDTGKRLTACVAHVLGDLSARS